MVVVVEFNKSKYAIQIIYSMHKLNHTYYIYNLNNKNKLASGVNK